MGPLGISCSSEFPEDCRGDPERCQIKGLHVHLCVPLHSLELLGKELVCSESRLEFSESFWSVLHGSFGQEATLAVVSPF